MRLSKIRYDVMIVKKFSARLFIVFSSSSSWTGFDFDSLKIVSRLLEDEIARGDAGDFSELFFGGIDLRLTFSFSFSAPCHH